MTLDLTTDELLSTTRSVRLRLDFDTPVQREVLSECLTLCATSTQRLGHPGLAMDVRRRPREEARAR